MFRIIASSQSEANRGFRVPANGTRIIAFGDPRGSALVVYANHVFADTEANQAAIMGGRAPAASLAFQFPLFLGVLGFAPIHPGGRTGTDSAWRMAAAGLLGLAVFWLLVVLPNADTDRGFLFTAALGALGAALWTGSRGRS